MTEPAQTTRRTGTGTQDAPSLPGEIGVPASDLRTFLIADIRGYTRFTSERGDEAAAHLTARFAVLTREGVEARRGRLLELRGDEALAVFGSARDALHAALDLQVQFAEATEADPRLPLPVGIGLDAGESIPVEGGYRGGALNLAARLCSLAGPGEVLASAGMVHLARRTEGVAYVERGEVALKGLAEPVRVIQILPEGAAAIAIAQPPIIAPALTIATDAPFVFLCYAHADAPFVARLSADLQAAGIPCWTDQRGLKPGTSDWEQAVRDAIRACQAVLLVASRDSRQSRYVKAELSLAEMYQRPIYPLWVAGEDWIDCIPLGLSATQYLDARGTGYQTALSEIVTHLGSAEPDEAALPTPPEEELTTEPRNPYKGLRAFTAADAGDFFGRGSVIDGLVTALGEALEPRKDGAARLLTVVGPSGSGKSSVVMAGLLPRLQHGALPHSDAWVYLSPIVPGNRPVEALTLALAEKIDRSLRAIRDDLDDDSSRGVHLLATQLVKARDGRVVLLIDQFEELFTQAADETERQQFVDLLVTAMTEPRGSVVVILTVRADFYHQTMRYPELWRLIERHTRAIAPLSVDELREVIEEPARLPDTRLRFEGALDGDLLFELRGQENALPLLQFTLDQLFERRDGRCLTMAAYRELGGVQGALAGHAEATYGSLPSDEHRAQARALFLRLIEPGASEQDTTRRRLDLTELVLPDARQTAILQETASAFVDARLLISNEVAGVSTLEVGHEALIRSWPRLYQWVQDDRGGLLVHRRLTEAALEWQREGDEGLLYRGTRLAALQDWVQRTDGSALNETERAFVDASTALKAREEQAAKERHEQELAAAQALAQSERRRAQVARSLLGVLGVVLVAALGTAAFAIQQSRQAQRERNAVIGQQRISKSHDLAASALGQLTSNPELGVLLASQAVRFAPTDQAENALRQALSATPVRAVLRAPGGPVKEAAFSPDGRLVATAQTGYIGQCCLFTTGAARVWDARTGKLLRTLQQGRVSSNVTFSPDGALIVLSSAEPRTGGGCEDQVWDAHSFRLVTILLRNLAGICADSMAFSPDSRLVVTAEGNPTAVQVSNARTGKLVWSAVVGKSATGVSTATTTGATFSLDGRLIATSSRDKTARLWDARTGKQVAVLRGHGDWVNSAAFSPNGSLLVTASDDRTARLWNVRTRKLVSILRGHTGPVRSAVFSRDGGLIVTASVDKTARVWDGHTGKPIAVLRGHTGPLRGAVFSPDGTLVLTASDDRTARVWMARTGRLLTTLRGHTGTVNSAAFNPDGTLVVTGSDDGTARVWRRFSGQLLTNLLGHRAAVTSAAFSPDSRRVVTASGDHTARVWQARSGERVALLRGHGDTVSSAAFSPNGRLIVTGSADGTARLWQAGIGKPVAILRRHSASVVGVALSPDNRLVATASWDNTAGVWDARTGRLLHLLQGHTGYVTSAAFSPDSTLIVTSSWDDTARIWQARTGKLVHSLEGHSGFVTSAAFSPDGRLVVTASWDHTARIWRTDTGTLAATLRGHTGIVNSAAFSPDGTLVVTAGADHTTRLWNAHTGKLVRTLFGHSGAVNSAVFSPDGTLIVTASQDKTARVWQTRTGKLLVVLGKHTDVVNSATFSPDGKLIVTASGDGTAHVYSCDVCGSLAQLRALAAQSVPRQLTPQERTTYL